MRNDAASRVARHDGRVNGLAATRRLGHTARAVVPAVSLAVALVMAVAVAVALASMAIVRRTCYQLRALW